MRNNVTDSRNFSLKFYVFICCIFLAPIFSPVHKCHAKDVIQEYIIIPMPTGDITVQGSDFNDTHEQMIKNAKKMTNLKGKNPSIGDIRELADSFGLFNETQFNPHLSLLGGDIAYWHGQRVSLQRLNLEFAARKIILQAADRDGVMISDQGNLSFAAQKILPEMLKRRSVVLNKQK